MKILLVHGRNCVSNDPKAMEEQWLAAIARGCVEAGLPAPTPDDFAMPYYGDRFDALMAGVDAPLSADISARGPEALDARYLEFRASFFEEVRSGAGITDAQIAEELQPLSDERDPTREENVQATLQALDKYMPRLTQGGLDSYARDLWAYLTTPVLRDEVDRIVDASVGPEPTLVIGHSLGSLVAYSLLRRVHNRSVPRLITLGCPLGLSAVRNQFRPLKFPDGVSEWTNIYDERDLVALHGLGPNVLPIQPPVLNDKSAVNQSRNCHGATGYLETAQVARAIFLLEEALIPSA